MLLIKGLQHEAHLKFVLKYSSKKLEEKAMGGGVLDQSKEGKKVHLPVACKQCAFPEHTFHSEFVLPINKNQITQMNFHDVM